MTGRTLRRLLPRLGRTLAMTALAAFVLLSMIGPSVALCVGADGHVFLEPAETPCCDDAVASPTGDAGVAATVSAAQRDGAAADCGDCVDVAFRTDVREQANPRVAVTLPAPSLAEFAVVAPSFARPAAPPASLADPGAAARDAVRVAARTAVLRV